MTVGYDAVENANEEIENPEENKEGYQPVDSMKIVMAIEKISEPKPDVNVDNTAEEEERKSEWFGSITHAHEEST